VTTENKGMKELKKKVHKLEKNRQSSPVL